MEITIGIVATVVGATLAALAQHFIPRELERREAKREGLPKLVGTRWKVVWYRLDPGGSEYEYVRDVVAFTGIRRGRLIGEGSESVGDYPLTGTIEDHGVLLFTYASGPTSSYEMVGSVVLRRDVGNREMEGHWSGLTRGNEIAGGRVVFVREP